MLLTNSVASVWKKTDSTNFADSGISHYECSEDGTIQWIKKAFPDVVTELLTQEEHDDEEEDEEG